MSEQSVMDLWLEAFSSTLPSWFSYSPTKQCKKKILGWCLSWFCTGCQFISIQVNIKPYLKGPWLCLVPKVCGNWPTVFAKLHRGWKMLCILFVPGGTPCVCCIKWNALSLFYTFNVFAASTRPAATRLAWIWFLYDFIIFYIQSKC